METYILLKVGKDKLKAEKREEREGKEVVAAGLEGKYKADELKDHLRQIRDELECKRVMLEIKEAGLNEIEVRGLKILLKEIFEALEMEVIDRPEDDKEEEKEEKKVEPVVELPEPKEIKVHGMDLAEDVKAYPGDEKEEEKVEPEEKPAFLEKEEEEIKHVSGWWLVLGIILIIGLVVGGLLFVNRNKNEEPAIVSQEELAPTETPAPTATPEPVEPLTEEEKVEMSIQILNGTGIPGRATIARARLENAGWGEVEVDNADNYDYVESEIQVKSGSGGIFTSLKEDMEEYYQVASGSFELSTNSEYDAIVILGEDKE